VLQRIWLILDIEYFIQTQTFRNKRNALKILVRALLRRKALKWIENRHNLRTWPVFVWHRLKITGMML
jgi:hypothetical protein